MILLMDFICFSLMSIVQLVEKLNICNKNFTHNDLKLSEFSTLLKNDNIKFNNLMTINNDSKFSKTFGLIALDKNSFSINNIKFDDFSDCRLMYL